MNKDPKIVNYKDQAKKDKDPKDKDPKNKASKRKHTSKDYKIPKKLVVLSQSYKNGSPHGPFLYEKF